MLTTADLDRMHTNDEWLGFGYLGERARMTPERRDRLDAVVLAAANARGWDYAQLFAWANSKRGRWYADCDGDRHAQKYL